MPRVDVEIKGISPLLMNQFPLDEIEGYNKMTSEEQAEIAAYRDPQTKQLYVPGTALQRCLVNAAAYSKGKGRATLQKQTAACLFINPERLSLGTDKYEVDRRAVVNPSTGGRIVRTRPKLTTWQVQFALEYDDTLLSEKEVREILDNAGRRVGLLDFRPERKGPFGRFMVTAWHPANGKGKK